MPSGITTATQIDNAIRNFVAEAQLLQEHKGVMTKLIDTRALPKGFGGTWNEPYISTTLEAVALVDGEEFDDPTQASDANIAITPGEVGVQMLWSHRMNLMITEDFPRIAADLMTNAIEYKRDRDLLGLLDGFAGSLGGGTAPLTVGIVSAAMAHVRTGIPTGSGVARTGARATGDPSSPPYSFVVHDFNRHDLRGQLAGLGGTSELTGAVKANFPTTAGTTQFNDQWIDQHRGITIDGATIYYDSNLSTTGNVIKGGAFAKMALVHVTYQGVQDYRKVTDDGRATKHTTWVDYGFGERNDVWGVELHLDATAPSV